jgi:hypothetical protein
VKLGEVLFARSIEPFEGGRWRLPIKRANRNLGVASEQETTTNLLQCWFLALQMFHPILLIPYKIKTLPFVGPVAQRLEQRTHNLPNIVMEETRIRISR